MDNPGSESTLDFNDVTEVFSNLLSEPITEPSEEPKKPAAEKPVEKSAEQQNEAETPEVAAERLVAEELAAKEGDQSQGTQKVTIEVDGKTVELTPEQIADAYKNGLRQADYTRKTMETAETRKTAEAEVAKARQERQEYQQKLNIYSAQLQGALEDQSKTDWDKLLQENPTEYLKQQHLYNQRQVAFHQAQQEQAKIQGQAQKEHEESLKAFVAKEREELLTKMPEWKDPEKASASQKAIKTYLSGLGYAEDEMNIVDHRAILLADKARKYDELMNRATAATKKVAPLPAKVERPGTAKDTNSTGQNDAEKRFMKTGKQEDLTSYFASTL